MKKVTKKKALEIGKRLGMDWDVYNLKEFIVGLRVELEHGDVTHGSLLKTGMIAKVHLDELPDYYTRLREMEER